MKMIMNDKAIAGNSKPKIRKPKIISGVTLSGSKITHP